MSCKPYLHTSKKSSDRKQLQSCD